MNKRAIACNYSEAISEASKGALCYVFLLNGGSGCDRVKVLVRSRSGRWILKWEGIHRLTNFRFKTIPPEHPRYNDVRIAFSLEEKELGWLTEAADREKAKRSSENEQRYKNLDTKKALEIAYRYGNIDGGHHKMWVIDQMVRALTGDAYETWVAEHNSGELGPESYAWDEGIAP